MIEPPEHISDWHYEELDAFINDLVNTDTGSAIDALTYLKDHRYDIGNKKWSIALSMIEEGIERALSMVTDGYLHMDSDLNPPGNVKDTLIIDGEGFPQEGESSLARRVVEAYQVGWKRFILHNLRGQRFIGCGLGGNSEGVRIDIYGSSGDYTASGLDGGEIYVHDNAQDQVGQIMNSGKLVIYGDVGQTFMYGAKGGEVYVMGNAAGRPLINAVGHPKVVINGTCLDYLAESFMAGDPLKDGGFVILNGIYFDRNGGLKELETTYPGGNLFSLASGGAIYIRDPNKVVGEDQLNGGRFARLSDKDWEVILPYLIENERLFGIRLDDLLSVDGVKMHPKDVYRKVEVITLKALSKTSYSNG